MELAIIGRHAISCLSKRGLVVARTTCGALMTSIDMAGFSISLLHLTPERTTLLDAPTSAPAWPAMHNLTQSAAPVVSDALHAHRESPLTGPGLAACAAAMVKAGAVALIEAEAQLTAWDLVAGDGDCGM